MTRIFAMCVECGAGQKNSPDHGPARLPDGWKPAKVQVLCGKCWRRRYELRELAFPLAEPASKALKGPRCELEAMWAQTTAACNWMLAQCYQRDIRRTPDMGNIPSMTRFSLCSEAERLFPDLPPPTVASLEQRIQRNYRSMRHQIVWNCAASLPTVRYPQPLPVHHQNWSLRFDRENRPIVTARVGNRKWELCLEGGSRYSRPIAQLQKMAVPSELLIGKWHDGTLWCKLIGWVEHS